MMKEMLQNFHQHVSDEGQKNDLAIHCKCIYSLDRAKQLKGNAKVLNAVDEVISSNFNKMTTQNQVNIGNIFAKNSYVSLKNESGTPRYFTMLEQKFVENTLKITSQDGKSKSD